MKFAYIFSACIGLLLLFSQIAQAESITSIAEARQQLPASEVTVVGHVTVASGAFASAMFDQGFQIQDATSGIYVSVAENPDLRIGDRVQVTGSVGNSFNLTTLSTSLENIEKLVRRDPIIYPTGSINDFTEGVLLTVQGAITRPLISDLPFGYKVYIDDGSGEVQIFIHDGLDFDPFSLSFLSEVGQVIRVRGTSAQFADEFEVTPRFRRDIRAIY